MLMLPATKLYRPLVEVETLGRGRIEPPGDIGQAATTPASHFAYILPPKFHLAGQVMVELNGIAIGFVVRFERDVVRFVAIAVVHEKDFAIPVNVVHVPVPCPEEPFTNYSHAK